MNASARQLDTAVDGRSTRTELGRRLPHDTRSMARIIDVGLVLTTVAAVATQAVVVWFHMIFVLLVVTALVLPLRGLAIRLAVWAVVATSLVTWDVVAHDTPSTELTEIPILTSVIVLVFLVARSREQSHAALRTSQQLVRERLEADRDSLRTQLEQSQRLDVLGRASTRIAHDLRNVLTIVQWCAADLIDDPDERHRRHGRDAAEAAQRGVDLLDEMLAIGREQSFEHATIDVVETVEAAVPLLRHLVPEHLRFDVRLPDSSAELPMSRTGLMQILMNLLTNAVDATSPGGTIRLEIDVVDRAAPTARARRVVTISMSDDGTGVDAELLPTIFDPGVSTKTDGHSGLGLSTVWTIVARAGGTTEFVSTSRGSRVDIVIPPTSEYVERHAVIEITDPDARMMLRDEFSALGFVVDDADAATTDDEQAQDSLLVIVHDRASDVDLDTTPDARLVDLRRHLGDAAVPMTREQAAIAVRRIVDEVTRGPNAA